MEMKPLMSWVEALGAESVEHHPSEGAPARSRPGPGCGARAGAWRSEPPSPSQSCGARASALQILSGESDVPGPEAGVKLGLKAPKERRFLKLVAGSAPWTPVVNPTPSGMIILFILFK